MSQKIITLHHDDDPECPSLWGGWKLISFNRNHINYQNPNNFSPPSIGLRRQLQTGTCFTLSYSEHGCCQWTANNYGHIPKNGWDNVGLAGMLVWQGEVKDLPKTYEEREGWADSFCESYTSWANGDVYGFEIEEWVTMPCGHKENRHIHSCYGFYSVEHMVEEICTYIDPGDEVKIEGEADYIADAKSFTKTAEVSNG